MASLYQAIFQPSELNVSRLAVRGLKVEKLNAVVTSRFIHQQILVRSILFACYASVSCLCKHDVEIWLILCCSSDAWYSPFTAARYHSLVIDRDTFPEDQLEITAWTDDGMIMGVQHKRYPHIQVWQCVLCLCYETLTWTCPVPSHSFTAGLSASSTSVASLQTFFSPSNHTSFVALGCTTS